MHGDIYKEQWGNGINALQLTSSNGHPWNVGIVILLLTAIADAASPGLSLGSFR